MAKDLLTGRSRKALRNHSAAVFDAAVIFTLAVALFMAAHQWDFAELVAEFLEQHEAWQLDEVVLMASILSLALIVFGIRRMRDQDKEISARNEAEERASALALHDPLTALPNRRYLLQSLRTLLEEGPGGNAGTLLLLLDLNGFKHINDVFGHPVGDDVLCRLAQRMQANFGAEAFIARLGGDEFALVLNDVDNAAAATRLARRIIGSFDRPVEAGGSEHVLGVGIGIALSPQDGTAPDDLLRKADIALYRAKSESLSSSCFFEKEMDNYVQERIFLEKELRLGVERGHVVPHYQPIVDLKTGEIVSFEALARWFHPERGLIPPDRFIPVAEDTALIRALTESILRSACMDAIQWPHDIVLSVNLSATLLKDQSIGPRILAILSETGLPPERLEIEVTESALVSNADRARDVLQSLRTAGIGVALDDFGTGYSSILHLRTFKFDKIKIDQSYIQALGTNPENDAIVRAMLGLAQGLGLVTTAEGVEGCNQRDELQRTGCQQGQGYLFGKAVPASEALELLRGGRAAADLAVPS